MAKANNKKEVKKIKVKIVYNNFKDKYTKKIIPVGTEMEMTEDRVNKNLQTEKVKGIKLIEILNDTTDLNDTTINNENGEENTNDAENTNNGESIDENEDNNAEEENGEENTNDAE